MNESYQAQLLSATIRPRFANKVTPELSEADVRASTIT